jgi:hypothetical protein
MPNQSSKPTNGRTEKFSFSKTRYTRHEVAALRAGGPSGRTISREAAQPPQPAATQPSTPANPSRQNEKY